MAGRVKHVERHALDGELLAFGKPHRDDVGLGLLAHHGDAMRAVAQRAEAGDVVGMQMRVDRLDQLEVELAHELEIAVDLLQHRIDDQRLAAAPAGEQVACRCRKRCRTAGGRSWRPPVLRRLSAPRIDTSRRMYPDSRIRSDAIGEVGHRGVCRERVAVLRQQRRARARIRATTAGARSEMRAICGSVSRCSCTWNSRSRHALML